ncbi:aldo/keto reductase, partial [Bifidobacterium pullorum]
MIDYTMNDGHTIPAVGYGVFLMSPAEVEAHLPEAIEAGYRHIDTANAYFNEKAVGRVVKRSGIDR